MKKLFSQRNKQLPDNLRSDIPDEDRKRILLVFESNVSEPHGGFPALLEKVGRVLLKRYGYLSRSSFNAARQSPDPVIEHFLFCETDKALDFIEACFQPPLLLFGQEAVKTRDEVNEVFWEMGIGYELTPYVEHQVEKEISRYGIKRKQKYIEFQYPEIILRDHQLLHQEVIEPSLQLLSDKRLRVTNSEMLKAHAALRSAEFADAITLSGSAFESFLKTICEIKGWKYDKDKATCSKLIGICSDNGLFPKFYNSVFEGIGTIRNKLGDAHGRGPIPVIEISREHAIHMVHLTSAHMLVISNFAGLS